MRFILSTTIILLLPVFLFSQIEVRKVEQDFKPAEAGGLFYMLPKTGFSFEVKIKKTIKVPGPYVEYATEYLGIEDVISSERVLYELVEIHVKTFNIPDPEQLYYVVYDERQSKDEMDVELLFSGSGIFLGAGASHEMELPASVRYVKSEMPDEDSLNRMFRFLAMENTYVKIDTIVKRISIDTLTIEDVSFKRSIAFMTTDQKARKAAEAIMELRKNQHNLLTGYQEVAYSEGTMKFMYNKLRKMENEYLDMFRGKIVQSQSTYYINFIPAGDDLNTWLPIFRFTSDNGFELLDEGNGQPVFAKFESENEMMMLDSALEQSESVVDKSKKGFYSRIPLMTDLSLKIGNDSYHLMKTLVPQFGKVTNIPKPYFNISLHPETGTLKSAMIKF